MLSVYPVAGDAFIDAVSVPKVTFILPPVSTTEKSAPLPTMGVSVAISSRENAISVAIESEHRISVSIYPAPLLVR